MTMGRHIARGTKNSWREETFEWRPRIRQRSVEQLPTVQVNNISKVVGYRSTQMTQGYFKLAK